MTAVFVSTRGDSASSAINLLPSVVAAATATVGRIFIRAADRATASAVPLDPSIEETMAIMADPETVRAIEEGDAAVRAGDVVSLAEFRRIVAAQRS